MPLDGKYFLYFVCGSIGLYFLRWLWLQIYPPQIPEEWKNNAPIDSINQAKRKIKIFIEAISEGEQEIFLSLSEEHLNAICKVKKLEYHFSISGDKLFVHEFKDRYVLSIKGYIFVTWEISFNLYFDNYFQKNIIIENDTFLGVKGGLFSFYEDDEYENNIGTIAQGRIANAIFKDFVKQDYISQGIPIDYIKKIEINNGNLILHA